MQSQIQLFRIFSIFLVFFSVVQLILAVVLPDLLPPLLKTWLVVVTGTAFLGITLGLFLSRKDQHTSLFFIVLASFISGLIFGISLVVIIVKVKN